MITIVEPEKNIMNLWGKQSALRHGSDFRLMKYILKVDCEDGLLLHNVVTGQLVLLSQLEADILDHLPARYSEVIKQLVDAFYLVPNDFDEHRQVVNTRIILRKLDASRQRKEFNHYVILPTTACNARCYYCFEQGVQIITMSEQIANDIVKFIEDHYITNNQISIMWFGGEPTVAAHRINQILEGLRAKGIKYRSTMVSNAFLFDKDMVDKAKTLWNLKRIQISVDGIEKTYNKVKNYKNNKENAYERVLHNVGLLIDNEIFVDLRMNFDLSTYSEFERLLDEVAVRYPSNKYLQVYAFPVIGEYVDHNGNLRHGDDKWLNDTTVRLNNLARKRGLYHSKNELPKLSYHGCGADDDHAVTINARGLLVECPERFEDDQRVGSVTEGITDLITVQSWKEVADHHKCIDCIFFPRCFRLRKCSAGDRCYFQDRNLQFYEAVKNKYFDWKVKSNLSRRN